MTTRIRSLVKPRPAVQGAPITQRRYADFTLSLTIVVWMSSFL